MASTAVKAAATEGKSLTPIKQIELKIGAIQKQLASAIPATMQKYLTPERLTRLFWQEARRNPKLMECSPESVASGLMTAAQLGIEIGVQGQGWLVPYFNKKARRLDAQFIPGYKGLIALARRSGEVLSVETHIVYEKDKFSLKLGIETDVVHEPYLDGDRGAPKLTYGVARFKDGGYHFEWMAEVEIQEIRKRSQSADFGPWVTDTDQMRRKTVIRRMSNYLPQSIEFANALTVDDAVNAGNKAVIAGQFVEVEEGAGGSEVGEGVERQQHQGEHHPEGEPSPDELLAMVLARCKSSEDATDAEIAQLALGDAIDFARSLTGEHKAKADAAIAAAKAVREKLI